MLLVRELEGNGEYAMAIYHVKQALFRIEPSQVELYLRLAELYDFSGMRSAAIRYYQYANQVVNPTPQNTARLRRLRERLKIGGALQAPVPLPAAPAPRRNSSGIVITG
jgi:tetratricopeptide (TPR) repeat protein